MRRLLPLLVLLVPAAALAQAPAGGGQPPVLRVPNLSPAGVAALDRLKGQQNPAIPKQLQDEAAVRREMQPILAAPTIDVDRLAAAMAHARAVTVAGQKIRDDNVLTMLRVLPPADRKALMNALLHPELASAQGQPR